MTGGTHETFASVVSDPAKFLSIAIMQPNCARRGETLYISDADVVGGFLHIPLNPVLMFLHLPPTLPHLLVGVYLRVHHAIYGFQESNRLFSREMNRVTVEDAQFESCLAEPQQFGSPDRGLKCIANVTADDNLILTNPLPSCDRLIAALAARFGLLTVNYDSHMHTGVEMTRLSNGGILHTQDQAIAIAASVVGVSHLPPAAIPAELDFFLPSFAGDEVMPVDTATYSSVTGKLV